MSYTELVLNSRPAKEAIAEGILTFLFTNDLQKGWDAMILKGKKNLSYSTLKFAILIDVIKAVTK